MIFIHKRPSECQGCIANWQLLADSLKPKMHAFSAFIFKAG
jgi:hypothetical protein